MHALQTVCLTSHAMTKDFDACMRAVLHAPVGGVEGFSFTVFFIRASKLNENFCFLCQKRK